MISIRPTKSKDGNLGIEARCGKYVAFIKTGVNSHAMEEHAGIIEEVSWVKDERKKLYFFIKMIKGGEEADIINAMFAGAHLHDVDYTNTLEF